MRKNTFLNVLDSEESGNCGKVTVNRQLKALNVALVGVFR